MRTLLVSILLFSVLSVQGQKQQLMLPLGHSREISEVRKSTNGKMLLSESTIDSKIWDIESGKLIKNISRCIGISCDFEQYALANSNNILIFDWYDKVVDTLIGHSKSINKIVFCPNNKFALSLSCDSTAKLWDLTQGTQIGSYPCTPNYNLEVKYSFDHNYALIGGEDSIRIIQVNSGKYISVLNGYRGVFHATAHELAYISKDSSIRIFDYETRKEKFKFRDHNDLANSVNYDPTGTKLASSYSDSIVIVRDIINNSHRQIIFNRPECKHSGWGVGNPRSDCLPDNDPAPNTFVVFSTDGNSVILRIRTEAHVFSTQIRSTNNGELKGSICEEYFCHKHFSSINELIIPNYAGELIFYEDNATIRKKIGLKVGDIGRNEFHSVRPNAVTTREDYTTYWDFKRGVVLKNFAGWNFPAKLLENSPVVLAGDSALTCYGIADLQPMRNLIPVEHRSNKRYEDRVGPLKQIGNQISFEIDPVEKYVLYKSDNYDTIVVRDLLTGSLIAKFREDDGKFTENDAQYIYIDNKTIVVRESKHWTKLDSVPLTPMLQKTPLIDDDIRLEVLGISTNGSHLAIRDPRKDTLDVIDLQQKKLVYSYRGMRCYFEHEKMIIPRSENRKHKSEVHDLKTGNFLYEIEGDILRIDAHIGISDNGTEILFWDFEKNQQVRRVRKNKAESLLDINVKEEIFLTEMNTSEVCVNSLQTGNRLYSIIFIDSTNYLVLDPEGRFDGTEAAKKMLYYVCGKEVIELEQLKDLCWEPDLVSKIMGVNKEPINAKKLSEIEICGVIPQIEEKGIRDGNYEFEINPQKGGVGEVLVFVNEKRVKSYKLSQLTKQSSGYLLRIPKAEMETYFVPGFSNRISVKANTADGTKSSRGIVVEQEATGEAKSPHLYLLCIGVNKYKDEQLRLKYAAKDAQDFKKVVTASAKKLFNIDDDEHIHPYVLLAADGSTTWAGKADIQKAFEDIAAKATPGDILLLFMAGHGVMTGENKQFYFLTAEATKMGIEGIEKEVAISSNELDEWMRNIKAQKQLLVMDACNSGKGQAELEKLYAARSVTSDHTRALERLKDRTGIFILAASAENQAAYEGGLYEQGFLTHSLLHTIKDGSAIRDNKFIDVNKWFNQSADFAEKLAESQGNRQTPRLVGHASFDIGIVDDSLLAQINLGDKKQFFTRSNFQNEETFNDDLNLSLQVDQMLKEISGRGDSADNILFTDANLQDAYKISGRYTVTDQELIVRVLVFKGSSTSPTLKLNLKAEKAKIDSLSKEIVEKVKAGLK